jgi:U11/U12 small nuclear ribonucleoprotein 25 kDa protein
MKSLNVRLPCLFAASALTMENVALDAKPSDSRKRKKKKDKKNKKDKKKKKRGSEEEPEKYYSKSKKWKKKRHRSTSSASEDECPDADAGVGPAAALTAVDLDVIGQYSHNDAVDLVRKSIDSLLSTDPLLSDLPTAITLDEVRSQIDLEHGQAMTVVVERHDGVSLQVIVRQKASVRDLKKAIEKATNLRLTRQEQKQKTPKINWKYVWKTYWLHFRGQKLKSDESQLHDYHIHNGDRIGFIKRLKIK